MTTSKTTAVYVRVSSRTQDHRSQIAELERWAKNQDGPITWFRDTASGANMNRPAMDRLMADIRAGKVGRIIVWRLDRLGRTAAGLTCLFDELVDLGVGLLSIRDSLDLGTAAGRLMANVLASVAAYEREVRGERQRAGIAAAKAAGKRWGGSKPGRRTKATAEKIDVIKKLRVEGKPIAAIARAVSLSRNTVYDVLASE